MRRSPRVLLVVGTALAAAAAALAPGASAAPAQVRGYVVVLEDGAGPPAAVAERLADRYGGDVGFVYSHALRGFSIRTTDRAAAALASNPNVDYVEADGVMSVAAQTTPTGIQRIFADDNLNLDIDGADDWRVDVDVAVIDTGVDLEHPDLDVAGSVDCTNESGGPWWNRTVTCSEGGDDDHYHGTHVAGTVAAIDNDTGVVGVAPGARLWAVKVLESNGSGSNSMVIAGIDWVAASWAGDSVREPIEVANLSLGGSYAQAVNDAVAGAVADGVSVVVAAGNSSADVENYSPASEPSAITVSALADFNGLAGGNGASTCRSDADDTFADFSNFGADTNKDFVDDPAVDLIAPGVCILSTYPIEDGSYGTISGTSMASPHVAGAVALLRSMGIDQSTAESTLIGEGNLDWTLGSGVFNDGVHEPLLDVSDAEVFKPELRLAGDGGTTPTNNPPAAAFTSDCAELTCDFTDGSSDADGSIVAWSWSFGDGTGSTDENPSHTYGTDGTYTVTLTVSDGQASDSVAQVVTVADGGDEGGTDPTTPTFEGSAVRTNGGWLATVHVSAATPGSTVTGAWNDGATPSSCVADAAGACDITRKANKRTLSVTWSDSGDPANTVTIISPL